MRSWVSFAASTAAVLALGAAPAAAAPVDDFADATGVLTAALRRAQPRVDAAAQARTDAALSCLDVLRVTPEPNRESLSVAYVLDLGVGAATVARPLLGRFLGRLERLRLRREPALMAARRTLRGQLALVDTLGLTLDDTCTVARRWQDAGWRTPPRSIRLQRRFLRIVDSYSQETDDAERRLRRAGHPRAARMLENFDIGDEPGTEDPIICALTPGCQ